LGKEESMRHGAIIGLAMLLLGLTQGCGDRLATMQEQLAGTWVLESRELPDGSRLAPPSISGALTWLPIDSRKAHVTLNVQMDQGGDAQRTFDFAASKYEISTSAITRSRYLLIRQGYRSSAATPLSLYTKAKSAKGKISLEETGIKITHERGYSESFVGDEMTASFPGVFTDTWRRVR
jgi:hypothetical protein